MHRGPSQIPQITAGLGLLLNFPMFGIGMIAGVEVGFTFFACSMIGAICGACVISNRPMPVTALAHLIAAARRRPK